MSAALLQRWRTLAGEDADALGEALIAAWAEPHRRYHSQGHLTWLLDEAERRLTLIEDARFVGYAIWFHDAIYEPARSDNEERSAAWARQELAGWPDLAGRVSAAIVMTKQHREGAASGDLAIFLDMDIAILGAPRSDYRAYAAGIRAEFGMFPDAAFAAGRARFLEQQLADRRTFRTDLYETQFGAAARANMRWEFEELSHGRMVSG
ncbi:MAG: hypothetical protein K2P58_12625 [Hyphomonadaceae bacterium]|nr:hypothetical protein [Hyphomonadaceae bacterium]